jgi:hypothetical protein
MEQHAIDSGIADVQRQYTRGREVEVLDRFKPPLQKIRVRRLSAG